MIRNIIIIGAMKAGTSSLFTYLSEHPEICPAITKEPNYFSDDVRYEQYRKKGYEALFDLKPQHKFTLEASTSYTKFPWSSGVAERMKSYKGLKPKFIYLVRNPFDRIESHYNFMMQDPTWNASIDGHGLIQVSNYGLQLQQYREYYRSEDIMVVEFENFIKNPKTILKSICKYVGADKYKTYPEFAINNKTRQVNRKQVLINTFLKKFIGWIPRPIKTMGTGFLSLFLPKKMKKLTVEQRGVIMKELEKDINGFGEEYGIDVHKWGFN